MSESTKLSTVRDTGRVTFLVDSSMYGELNAVPIDVYGDLNRLINPHLHYHYSGPICAHRWLDVCDDPEYGHLNLLSRVEDVFPSLMDAINVDRSERVNIVLTSLGPGDGALDLRMLQCLDAGSNLESYCGLDFSFDLLRRAVYRIEQAKGFKSDFPIRAVCGDFTDVLPEALNNAPDGCIRMFSLTGFTLGNYKEDELLRNLRILMSASDYLFLDARLHGLGNLSPNQSFTENDLTKTINSYNLSSVRRFVFGPLEVSTYASSGDVDINFELTDDQTTIPSGLNVGIFCTGLNTKMRLTGKPVQRDRLDLAITTLYHLEDLKSWFGTVGFSTVWYENVDGVAFFLLKKRDCV